MKAKFYLIYRTGFETNLISKEPDKTNFPLIPEKLLVMFIKSD